MRVMKYVDVIIPLRFRDSVTYSVPQELEGRIVPGSIVKVTVVGRSYTAVVLRVKDVPGFDPSKIIPLRDVVKFPPVTQANMDFLRQVASYYMCSLGEAFRFAAPSTVKALKRDKAREADVEEATGNGSGRERQWRTGTGRGGLAGIVRGAGSGGGQHKKSVLVRQQCPAARRHRLRQDRDIRHFGG